MVPKVQTKNESVQSKLEFLLKQDFNYAIHEYDMVQGLEAVGICIDRLNLMVESKHQKKF